MGQKTSSSSVACTPVERLECRQLMSATYGATAELGRDELGQAAPYVKMEPQVASFAPGRFTHVSRVAGNIVTQNFTVSADAIASDGPAVPLGAVNPDIVPEIDAYGSRSAVVWVDHGSNDSYSVRLQCMTGGTRVGSAITVATGKSSDASSASVALDAEGDMVVTWIARAPGSGGHEIKAQRLNWAGAKQGKPFAIGTGNLLALDADENGDFAAAWNANGGVSVQRFSASGARIGSFTLAGEQPELEMAADGRFVVSVVNYATNNREAHLFSSGGAITRSIVLAPVAAGDLNSVPSLDVEPDGAFAASWVDAVVEDFYDSPDPTYITRRTWATTVVTQRYDATGTPLADQRAVSDSRTRTLDRTGGVSEHSGSLYTQAATFYVGGDAVGGADYLVVPQYFDQPQPDQMLYYRSVASVTFSPDLPATAASGEPTYAQEVVG